MSKALATKNVAAVLLALTMVFGSAFAFANPDSEINTQTGTTTTCYINKSGKTLNSFDDLKYLTQIPC